MSFRTQESHVYTGTYSLNASERCISEDWNHGRTPSLRLRFTFPAKTPKSEICPFALLFLRISRDFRRFGVNSRVRFVYIVAHVLSKKEDEIKSFGRSLTTIRKSGLDVYFMLFSRIPSESWARAIGMSWQLPDQVSDRVGRRHAASGPHAACPCSASGEPTPKVE
jgi:hypothetical protein